MTASEYLKKNTAKFHDAAEALFNSNKIFSKTFTLEDYRKLIQSNHKMLLHSEERIFEILSGEFKEKLNLDARRKLSLIENDLNSLHILNKSAQNVPDYQNKYEALGAMYVIEGSTLGGNVIAKQLSKTEGFGDVTFHFFGCYGEKTGMMWKDFKEVLDSEVSQEYYDEVLKGAEKLYRFLLSEN